jgi:hypothetical protein
MPVSSFKVDHPKPVTKSRSVRVKPGTGFHPAGKSPAGHY